jgi:membrane glycosyltransferase
VFFLLADSPPTQRENELSVIEEIKRRLRESGHADQQHRIVLEEYRDKIKSWRHKCGSILMWLQRYAHDYEHMFVLDADSSLSEEDPHRPETCDVLARMVVAMRDDPNLAMIQAGIEIRDYRTWWGWVQCVNTRIGTNYYFPVFSFVYGRTVPCYGHNCLLRVSDFVGHVQNTLLYTSHDHVDSSDLAAAGRGCVLSNTVLTYEQAEDTLPGWFKREARWSRGNGQWVVYMLKKRGLPLGVIAYLTLGVFQYLWAVLASVFFIFGIVLIYQGYALVDTEGQDVARIMVAAVVLTMLVPKLLACPRIREFIATSLLSLLLGPTLLMYQGVCFLMGAFGAGWIPRGARSSGFGMTQVLGTITALMPAMIVGLILSALAREKIFSASAGDLLIGTMIMAMILSPLTALLLSWPFAQRQIPAPHH